MSACFPPVQKRGPKTATVMKNISQCDSANNRNESLQDVFSVNTFLLLIFSTDVLMLTVVIVFQQCAEATAQGREGAPVCSRSRQY